MKKAPRDAVFFLILLLWPVGLPLAFLLGARLWSLAQKPLIRHQVLENLPAMTALAEEALAAADGGLPTRDVIISERGDTVWYETSGFGLGPATRYCGYCYAADGAPHPYPGMEDYDEAAVMFGFRWNEPTGDNGCYLQHIAENFYYYEVWF